MSAWRRLVLGVLLLLLLLATGAFGYMLIEGWSFLDALYMTVTTITTVGFREVNPLGTGGRVFTIFLILLGVGIALYILVGVVGIVVEGELGKAFGLQRMKARIRSMRGHFVLCGFGRVGEEIGREFTQRGIPFVVVESNPEAMGRARERGYLLVEGDASSDAVLLEAGIERARGLLAASDSDAGNTYITLTAKAMRPEMLVVARAGQPQNQEKLRRAGADRVISPYLIGGRRMALSALQPLVVDFVDTLVGGGRLGEKIIAEVEASEESGLIGRSVGELVPASSEAVVLAVQQATGALLVSPRGSLTIGRGDILIVFGRERDIEAFARHGREKTAGRQARAPLPRTTPLDPV